MEHRRQESELSSEIPTEIQDILVRLPTKDVVQSSCISKLWCRTVRDPFFPKLHGANHVAAPSESEALRVSEKRDVGV
jgi:hypothetical protein